MAKKTEKLPSQRRLKTLEDVRRFLADVINRLNRDEIDPNKASKLGYLCQITAKIIEGSDLETRVAKIERLMEEKRKGTMQRTADQLFKS